MERNNFTKQEQLNVDLNGTITFWTEVKRAANLMLDAVPNHKTITSRIETALNAALADNTPYEEREETDYDAPRGVDGYPVKVKRYYSTYVSLNKDSWSNQHEFRIYATKPEYSTYAEDGTSRNKRDYASVRALEPSEIKPALEKLIADADSNIASAKEQLKQLKTVEADYMKLKQAINEYNDKYGYAVKSKYEIRNIY